jgi:hypothetical protein
MNRKLFGASALTLVGAFASTLAVTQSTPAEAAYRRVSAVTSCFAEKNINVTYDNNYWVTFVNELSPLTANGFLANFDDLAVRCNVPTDSYLPHQNIQDVHISGKVGTNDTASYAKACSIDFWSGSYHCGAQTFFPQAGSFNLALDIPSTWSEWSRYPVVTAVLGDGDRLHGIYYAD